MAASPVRFCGIFSLLCFLAAISCAAKPAEVAPTFDAANKLYEQGQFPAAAAVFHQLLTNDVRTEAVLFNLGNAHFKAGQVGRAIAAWRQVERLNPRDPGVRFNLAFARKRVTGSDAPAGPLWRRALRNLTLNEWTVLASSALWLWFLLLALREFKPALHRTLSGYTATAGAGALLLSGCLAGAFAAQSASREAVVIVSEAIPRIGPLDEARVLDQFRLRDGTELDVLDEKALPGATAQTWLQVRDRAGHTGWVKADQVIALEK